MLLNAVIIFCVFAARAELPPNSYSFTGSNDGYDYNNAIPNNGYYGSKESYQNVGSFYSSGDADYKLPSQTSSHSSINGVSNQRNIGSEIGSSYGKYSANDQPSEYSGYSKTYENPDSDSYNLPNQASSSISYRGYSAAGNNNGESAFNTYSDSVHKDTDFSQYASGSSNNAQRVPAFPEYPRPAGLENYPEGSNGEAQNYHGISGMPSYSAGDHVFPSSFPPTSSINEYPFGKQKDFPYSNLNAGGKYNDVFSVPTETRYTRANAGHVSHNYGVSSYLPGTGPSGHLSKIYGSGTYSAGKPYKYGYKYLTRYAPNSGVPYMPRERDSHYTPYSKGGTKLIIIKDSRRTYSHPYPEESPYGSDTYRSKSAGYSPSFDGYTGGYDEGPTAPRRYRNAGPGHIFLQKMYP